MSEIDFNALPGTEMIRFVCAQPGNTPQLALVFKRAFTIASTGRCELTEEALQLQDDVTLWEAERPLPLVSPPRWDADLYAFKPATDIVVQGHAYAYNAIPTVDVELRAGPITRVVRVHGDRHLEWTGQKAAFTPPAPFMKMPLRYDRAYGGVDTVALAREGDPLVKAFQAAQPRFADIVAGNTEFHYPRNPSGCGYLMTADRESIEAAKVPNLEFPFDPVTPERLAVGKPEAWLRAPLPAGFDWYHPSWFPRLAFAGQVHEHEKIAGDVPETRQGWIPPDILTLSQGRFPFFDLRFQQGASPGLAISNFPPDAELFLKNLFPSVPEKRLRLPGTLPKVTIALKPSDQRETRTKLTAVVVQPDENRVILVYAAICEVSRRYGNHEMAVMKWSIA
ncbi:MAG: DUF2169 domain-containing protein [Desulfobacterales bacterium]|jgi:hypothetical protein|nr:DUF2169 domain-containing protein [Desulfobacterales bacterium]